MSSINAHIEGDFFEYNPEVMYFDPVVALVREYGREQASKYMWAVYLTEDPQSTFYSYGSSDKRAIVSRNYLKDTSFDWDILKDVIAVYPTWFLSPIERNYKSLTDTFDRIVAQAAAFDITDNSEHKKALDLFKNIKTIFEGLAVIKKLFDQEQAQKKQSMGQDQAGTIAGRILN